jgi:hypothetical protein
MSLAFAYPKSQFGMFLKGLGMDNVAIFNDHFPYFTDNWYTYFMVIWHILRSFGTFLGLRYLVDRQLMDRHLVDRHLMEFKKML